MVGRPGTGLIGHNCLEMFWLWEERRNLFSQHLASWVCADCQASSEGEGSRFYSRGSLRTPSAHYPSPGLRTQGQLLRLSVCFLELLAPVSEGGVIEVTVIILENLVGLGLKATLLFQDSPFPWGSWVSQLVKRLPLAQLIISGSWDQAAGGVLCLAGSLLLPLPLCSPTSNK